MSKFFSRVHISPLSALGVLNACLVIGYLGIFATVMSYAALSVEFAQSVRNDLGEVGRLESAYLAKVGDITRFDTKAEGYAKPVAQIFVPKAPSTALNLR